MEADALLTPFWFQATAVGGTFVVAGRGTVPDGASVVLGMTPVCSSAVGLHYATKSSTPWYLKLQVLT